MSGDTSLPPRVEDRVRTYLAAFLPAGAVDDALSELAADLDYWQDSDEPSVFRTAHHLLASRVRVADDVEALVLHDEAGLPVSAVARVLDIPEPEVRRLLDAALVQLGEPPTAPVAPVAAVPASDALRDRASAPVRDEPGEPPPWSGPRLAVAAVGVLLMGAIVAGVVLAADSAGDCRSDAAVEVSEARMASALDDAGRPVNERDSFSSDEQVVLWVDHEARGTSSAAVTVRWARAGVELYRTDVRLPEGGTVGVSLSRMYAEPGSYSVEVRDDGCVLAERRFEITDGS